MALRTPLHDWHAAHGAVMVEFAGWHMPIRYGPITDEHNAVRNCVGLFDVSHMGRLSFEGDGLGLIQHVWTNNASTMKDMQARYGLICNEHGGMLDDVLVYRWPYGWAMVVNAPTASASSLTSKRTRARGRSPSATRRSRRACSPCRGRRRSSRVKACSRRTRRR